jgi:arylsulfatase
MDANNDNFIIHSRPTQSKQPYKRFTHAVAAGTILAICAFLVAKNQKFVFQFIPASETVFQALVADERLEQQDVKNNQQRLSKQCHPSENHTCPTVPKQRKPHKPLNILLLYGDDWRHDSLGSASQGFVQTPFLDSLANRGIRFTHNCVTTAICWISRATLYMGQYMSRHKTTTIRVPHFYEYWNDSFVRLLQTEAGYHVGHVGKWHFNNFERIQSLWNYSTSYQGHHWFSQPGTKEKIHVTKRNEKDALEFLATRPKDQPFFLGVCFFAPHAVDHEPEQYFPQPTSMGWYNNTTIPKADSATDDAWKRMPQFFTDSNEGRIRWRWRFETEVKHQSMMKNYYRLISEIDETSRRIVQELADQGILNETLVIFTTDNGLFHAEHGLAGKWYPHEESIRVPLIIQDPRMDPSHHGTTNDDFTLSVDLATTILGAANVSPHPRMQGRDISELYLNSATDWREEFFYEHPTHLSKGRIPGSTALVRKDWKYMRWIDFGLEQLFDLKNDPHELNDLIDLYSNSTLVNELRTRHNELQALAT